MLTDHVFTEAMGSGDGLQALADALTSTGIDGNGDTHEKSLPCQLQTLKLNSIGTFVTSHASAWQPVWRAISSLPALRHLELGGNAFGEVALGGLRSALQQASQLHIIGLGHPTVLVPLCMAGLRTLGSAFAAGQSGGYCIGDGLHLDLSHAQLTAADACIIADALDALTAELATGSQSPNNKTSQRDSSESDCFLTSLDLSHNTLTMQSVTAVDDGGNFGVQLLAYQLGTRVQRLGQIDHLTALLTAASRLPSLTSLSLANNNFDPGDTLSVAPSILGAVLRVGALNLSGNGGTDEGGEVREAFELLTAGLQGLSWCKVMHSRLGATSCARLLPPDLVQTIADLVTPTPILIDMLLFGQPAVGVAERARMSQAELADGDEFFEECQDWMADSAKQLYSQHSAYGLPAQMQHNHMHYQHHQQWAWNPAAAGMHMHMVDHAQEPTPQDAELDAAFDQFLRESGQV